VRSLEKEKKKPYIYPHKHCIYCGKMITVEGRDYCLKCKPEHEKETSKIQRSKKIQKFINYYIIAVLVLFIIIIAYYSFH
jgi:predicted nucleic acid-binding Zn ribbon protein